MRVLRLLIERLLVLGLGALTVWVIAFFVFDAADKRLPLALALGTTYALAAYVILPRAIRLGLRILGRGHVPSYATTGDGLPGDPVNLALIGTMDELRRAFAAAGWHEADRLSLRSSLRMVQAFVLNRSYPTAPFSTLYLFGRGHDIGLQRSIGGSPRKRNHVRFWAISLVRAELNTPAFWRNAAPPQDREPLIWVGAGTRDTGLSLTRLTFQITHATDADTNAERDFIMGELDQCGVIANVRTFVHQRLLPKAAWHMQETKLWRVIHERIGREEQATVRPERDRENDQRCGTSSSECAIGFRMDRSNRFDQRRRIAMNRFPNGP